MESRPITKKTNVWGAAGQLIANGVMLYTDFWILSGGEISVILGVGSPLGRMFSFDISISIYGILQL
jgi:hypothetical protein